MATDYGTIGNKLTRYVPVPGRAHPESGGSISKGDMTVKSNRAMVSGRSRSGKASAKLARFVHSQGRADGRMDRRPTPCPQRPALTAGSRSGAASDDGRGDSLGRRAMVARIMAS